MTWNFHINEVSKKISRNIGILKKLQLIVPNNILLTIYNTLILPHIIYCLLSLGSKPDKISRLQKRAVRAISGAKVDDILLEGKTSTTTQISLQISTRTV